VPVTCVEVAQVYSVDGEDVTALRDVDLTIEAGESVTLFGPSGSGKSTLVSLLAGLRRPTSGEIWLGDDELGGLTERELLTLRGRKVGIVVQNPSRSLLPYGTAEDNIRFAQAATPTPRRAKLPQPIDMLRQLGLDQLAGQRAARLSGGEQQRLSIAVAMATLPRLLLADEPTSQLDSASRDLVIGLFTRISTEFGATMAVVTHDDVVADALHRRITLSEGRVVDHRGESLGRGFDDGGERRSVYGATWS
jgi:ABC-type lipoprotein export system ATPase subunit